MDLKIFSIYDEKGKIYMAPYFLSHTGQGIRTFSDIVQDKQTSINKHPEDYSLYHIGEFCNVSGKVQSTSEPQFIVKATDFDKQEKSV